VVER
jgi:hypothetical protein